MMFVVFANQLRIVVQVEGLGEAFHASTIMQTQRTESPAEAGSPQKHAIPSYAAPAIVRYHATI